jgi:signal transduction histidine kinase
MQRTGRPHSMESQYLDQLFSQSPNDRARAINWIRRNPGGISSADLMKALQVETIPRLRRGLNDALRTMKTGPQLVPVEAARVSNDYPKQEGNPLDVVGLIRHELSPAVGWIRLAADVEILDFDNSQTNVAVRRLQKRIDGLVALIKQSGSLAISRIVLGEALLYSWPDPEIAPVLIPEDDQGQLEVETDESLFYLVLANAYQNAIDASREATGKSDVSVAWGRLGDQFWIRMTNPFAGNSFTFESILGEGKSSKDSHQGKGVSLMQMATLRLGLSFKISGQSGLATARFSGRVSRG